jgi:hypothetical protein
MGTPFEVLKTWVGPQVVACNKTTSPDWSSSTSPAAKGKSAPKRRTGRVTTRLHGDRAGGYRPASAVQFSGFIPKVDQF